MTIKEKLCKSLWFQFLFLCVIGLFVYNASVYAEDAEEWMPDPILRTHAKIRIYHLASDEHLHDDNTAVHYDAWNERWIAEMEELTQ